MTPAPMIAIMVIVVAILFAFVISAIFFATEKIIWYFRRKNCHHICRLCEYRTLCDFYLNKK